MKQLIFENPEILAVAAAQSFGELAQEAITSRGRINVALAGGSTPKVIYEKLAGLPLPWEDIHLFWGDERLVPITDSRSNYCMVQEALLKKISIPAENVHRVQTNLEPSAKEAFQLEMSNYFLSQGDHFLTTTTAPVLTTNAHLSGVVASGLGRKGLPYKKPFAVGEGLVPSLPFTDSDFEHILKSYQTELEGVQFDLVHLGLGMDGHMASLFPATNLELNALAQLTFPTPKLEPQVPRLSLSLQTINAARVKQFFVTGTSKKNILEQIKNGADYPAARVQNAQWWLDKAASTDE